MVHILSNLKTFKKVKKRNFLNMTWNFLLTSSYISIFYRKLNFYLFLLDCELYFIFFRFLHFCKFQCPFNKNTFVLTFIIKNILRQFGLKGVKIHKIKKNVIFSNKLAVQNNPLKQLRLIFHKTVNTNKLKSEIFKVVGWVVFQQLRKL